MRLFTFASSSALVASATASIHAASASGTSSSSSSASASAFTPYIDFNTISYITDTVSAYTTYFSAATQFALSDKTYMISEATTLTMTDGPFTVVRPLIAHTIVAGCATCYPAPTTASLTVAFSTPLPSLDANGTSVGTASLQTDTAGAHMTRPTDSGAATKSSSASKSESEATSTRSTSQSAPVSSSSTYVPDTITLSASTAPLAADDGMTSATHEAVAASSSISSSSAAAASSASDPAYTGAAGRSVGTSGRAGLAAVLAVGFEAFAH